MAKYETMMVTTANLDEEASNALINKFKNLIAANGTIDSVDDWGKKRLAYEIQKMKEGFYYFVHFESDSVCPNEVENHIRIMEPVIRYLCVRQDA
jgi:small subunit ribosomal protein S6